jgi:hypothetical protein
VARLRPRRAMLPHLGVRIARVTVPAALGRPLLGAAGAVTPGDDTPVAYPAASTTSPDSTAGAPRLRGQEATGRAPRSAMRLQHREWVRDNAKTLGMSEVISRQHIWTVRRGSEGWRPISDRRPPTANHMDHAHVSIYSDSGTA